VTPRGASGRAQHKKRGGFTGGLRTATLALMPVYEYRCPKCERIEEVFVRSLRSEVKAPMCRCDATKKRGTVMQRAPSLFAQHRTFQDQVTEAEAKYGKEVDAAMGTTPDVDVHARRYDSLSKDLPPE
jgi:hypothetical protein